MRDGGPLQLGQSVRPLCARLPGKADLLRDRGGCSEERQGESAQAVVGELDGVSNFSYEPGNASWNLQP